MDFIDFIDFWKIYFIDYSIIDRSTEESMGPFKGPKGRGMGSWGYGRGAWMCISMAVSLWPCHYGFLVFLLFFYCFYCFYFLLFSSFSKIHPDRGRDPGT